MFPLIVTAAIIRKNETVLLTLRPETSRHGGMWEFPGGKLTPNESPRECLHREILEELGIEVAVGNIFDVVYFRYPQGPVLILAFECQHQTGTIRNLEVAEHRWVALNDLTNYAILPADLPIIEKLRAASRT